MSSHKLHLSHEQCLLIKNVMTKALSDIEYANVLSHQHTGEIWPDNNYQSTLQLVVMLAELPEVDEHPETVYGFCT